MDPRATKINFRSDLLSADADGDSFMVNPPLFTPMVAECSADSQPLATFPIADTLPINLSNTAMLRPPAPIPSMKASSPEETKISIVWFENIGALKKVCGIATNKIKILYPEVTELLFQLLTVKVGEKDVFTLIEPGKYQFGLTIAPLHYHIVLTDLKLKPPSAQLAIYDTSQPNNLSFTILFKNEKISLAFDTHTNGAKELANMLIHCLSPSATFLTIPIVTAKRKRKRVETSAIVKPKVLDLRSKSSSKKQKTSNTTKKLGASKGNPLSFEALNQIIQSCQNLSYDGRIQAVFGEHASLKWCKREKGESNAGEVQKEMVYSQYISYKPNIQLKIEFTYDAGFASWLAPKASSNTRYDRLNAYQYYPVGKDGDQVLSIILSVAQDKKDDVTLELYNVHNGQGENPIAGADIVKLHLAYFGLFKPSVARFADDSKFTDTQDTYRIPLRVIYPIIYGKTYYERLIPNVSLIEGQFETVFEGRVNQNSERRQAQLRFVQEYKLETWLDALQEQRNLAALDDSLTLMHQNVVNVIQANPSLKAALKNIPCQLLPGHPALNEIMINNVAIKSEYTQYREGKFSATEKHAFINKIILDKALSLFIKQNRFSRKTFLDNPLFLQCIEDHSKIQALNYNYILVRNRQSTELAGPELLMQLGQKFLAQDCSQEMKEAKNPFAGTAFTIKELATKIYSASKSAGPKPSQDLIRFSALICCGILLFKDFDGSDYLLGRPLAMGGKMTELRTAVYELLWNSYFWQHNAVESKSEAQPILASASGFRP